MTITPVKLNIGVADFNDDQQTLIATLDDSASRLVVINELAILTFLNNSL